jgi:polyhydroxybutyrate depolymerase
MTMTLVCARPELFVAAASVIMNLTDEFRRRLSSVAAGAHVDDERHRRSLDPVTTVAKGDSHYAVDGFWSTPATLAFWRRINGCESEDAAVIDLGDRDPDDLSRVTRIEFALPAGARRRVLTASMAAATACPAPFSDARFPRIATAFLGPQNHDIDGAGTIWAFFRKFP